MYQAVTKCRPDYSEQKRQVDKKIKNLIVELILQKRKMSETSKIVTGMSTLEKSKAGSDLQVTLQEF